ncbi:MAG: hypothetical protein QM820_36750 [Minicystis sp.]
MNAEHSGVAQRDLEIVDHRKARGVERRDVFLALEDDVRFAHVRLRERPSHTATKLDPFLLATGLIGCGERKPNAPRLATATVQRRTARAPLPHGAPESG